MERTHLIVGRITEALGYGMWGLALSDLKSFVGVEIKIILISGSNPSVTSLHLSTQQ